MKKIYSFLSIFLLFFVFNSCKFLNLEKTATASIVINFASKNNSRAVSYTKEDLSYFVISIEPNVQNDIKIDLSNDETKAEFTELEEGTYKILVSAFNTTDTKIAYGESEFVEVKSGETTLVSITMKFLKHDVEIPEDNNNISDNDIDSSEEDNDIPEEDENVPSDDNDILEEDENVPGDDNDTPEEDENVPDDDIDIPDDDTDESNGFIEISGITITGTETWELKSSVFISNRQLTIPDLIVCDHEVTRGEFKKIMGVDPSVATAYSREGNELSGDAVLNNPVNYVNWYAAIAYCNKLSLAENLTPCYSVEGITDWESLDFSDIPSTSNSTNWNSAICNFEANGYRLPTEAEWEWLARGGENYTYAGSNTIDEVAWYNTNTSGSRDVKTKKANSYGLFDISGNVQEWCWDWYETNLNSSHDKTGPESGSVRVVRGGNWGRAAQYCEITERNSLNPFTRNSYYGFRVVRTNSVIVNDDTFNWYEIPIDADTRELATPSSTYIYFGVFPKTVVPESNLAGDTPLLTIDENNTKNIGGNTYYKGSDNNWYAKSSENSHGTSYTYSDGSTVKQDTSSTRYFKVEPIKWKVLTTDYNESKNALLVAENVLIGNIPFYENKDERTIDGDTVYANNYKYSTIRAYLNGQYESGDTQTDVYTNKGFFQTAFTMKAQSYIATTQVQNSAETTGYNTESYATYICEDTTDKIFLLSESEVVNTDYGFDVYDSNSFADNHKSRHRVSTDFAKANNVNQSSPAAYWWVRSPYGSSKVSARSVTYNGALNGISEVITTHNGIVPAMTISF